ncbi:MAG: glutamine synthetase [Proteobacteria bacterium]|nr:glutamine synthetase [Pseudomonadota bacterium]
MTDFATLADLGRFAQANPDIVSLDAFVIDVNGNAIGKRVPMLEAEKVFKSGVAFSACAPLLDCRGRGHDAGGRGASDGDPDGIALPLAGTLVRVPWAKTPTAQVMCVMREYGTQEPLWFDQRVILEEIIARCRSHGLHAVIACELEFYLVDSARTPQGHLRLATNPRTRAAPSRPANLSLESIEDQSTFLAQIETAAQAQGIPLGSAVAEYGIGQFEVNLRHVADPLLAADHAALLRRLVRGVARANNEDATFIAKPFRDQPGNGMHIHISLVDEAGRNRFGADGGTRLLHQAVAGMQALMFDSLALFAPNFNSFRRFLGPYVPNTTAWGHNNRSVAFRIPAAGAADMRIEHRVAGADASPHLVVAAVLAGALHGITHALEPTVPVDGKALTGRDPTFPRGLWAALERMSASPTLADYFSQRYLAAYAHLKRGEFETLFEDITARELDFYA